MTEQYHRRCSRFIFFTREHASEYWLDAKKREELAKSTEFMEAYAVYNALASAAQKVFQEKGQIWVNEDFRDLDLRRDTQQGG